MASIRPYRALFSQRFEKKSIVRCKPTNKYCLHHQYLFKPWACSRRNTTKYDQTHLQSTFATGPQQSLGYLLCKCVSHQR